MKAYVDKDLCIGCGLCESLASGVFRMDDDGKAEAIEDELSVDVQDQTEEARNMCPSDAITID